MGFLDSLKDVAKTAMDTAKTVSEQAKAKYDEAKENRAAQNAEREAARKLEEEQAKEYSQNKTEKIYSGKDNSKTGIFQINSMADTLSFTKEYMKK